MSGKSGFSGAAPKVLRDKNKYNMNGASTVHNKENTAYDLNANNETSAMDRT
jgi:hypothetical protein